LGREQDEPIEVQQFVHRHGENQGSPGIGIEVANWLIERKVAIVGGDSCCVEVRVPKESVRRLLFLGQGIPLLENLDLAGLAPDGATEFLFLGLPERIKERRNRRCAPSPCAEVPRERGATRHSAGDAIHDAARPNRRYASRRRRDCEGARRGQLHPRSGGDAANLWLVSSCFA
jgi:hypothetical protein